VNLGMKVFPEFLGVLEEPVGRVCLNGFELTGLQSGYSSESCVKMTQTRLDSRTFSALISG